VKRALLVLAATGCTPHFAAGYDTTSNIAGPLRNMVTQPAATARQDPSTVAPVAEHRSYAFSIGGGNRHVSVSTGLQLHDINSATFSLPTIQGVDPLSPRYLLSTLSVDCNIGVLLLPHFDAGFHVGPAAGIVIDRTDGSYSTAKGMRFGATAAVWWGKVAAFADLYETDMAFTGGPAKGTSTLTGVTVGVALR
jgi:hypothetical protein